LLGLLEWHFLDKKVIGIHPFLQEMHVWHSLLLQNWSWMHVGVGRCGHLRGGRWLEKERLLLSFLLSLFDSLII
jgi:hypothetical protein